MKNYVDDYIYVYELENKEDVRMFKEHMLKIIQEAEKCNSFPFKMYYEIQRIDINMTKLLMSGE